MTATPSIQSIVTDTNGRLRGAMDLEIEFNQGAPGQICLQGQVYRATGKEGVHTATAKPTREMATESDARLWITLDGTCVWED